MLTRRGESGLFIPNPAVQIARTFPGTLVQSYSDKVKGTATANLIAYWRLQEASGTVADNYEGTAARDAAYTAVTLGQPGIGDGLTCPRFDGSTSYCNIYTTSFSDAFNGAEGTMFIWAKARDAAYWTEGTEGVWYKFEAATSGGFNRMFMQKTINANQLFYEYRAGNVAKQKFPAFSGTAFFSAAMTWSAAADQCRFWLNGTELTPALTGLGTWVGGALASAKTLIGARTTPPTPANWNGYCAHAVYWNIPLSAVQIEDISTL